MDINSSSSIPPQKFDIYNINNDLLKMQDLKTKQISFFNQLQLVPKA